MAFDEQEQDRLRLIEIRERELAIQGGADVAQDRNYLAEAAVNIPGSALELGKGIYKAVRHPIETAKEVGGLALGAAEKLIPGEQKHEYMADAVGRFFSDRYGSVEAAQNTFATDPVGFLADVSTLFTGGGALVAKLGKIGKIAKVAAFGKKAAKVGKFIEPVGLTAKAIGKATIPLREAGKGVIGVTTGTGAQVIEEAIEQAIKEPYMNAVRTKGEFVKALRGKTKGEDILADSIAALDEFKRVKRVETSAQFEKLKKSNIPVNKLPIKKRMGNLIKEFEISFDPDTGKILDSVIDPDAWTKIERAIEKVDDLGKVRGQLTVRGLHRLKRTLDDLSPAGSKSGRAFISSLRNKVKSEIEIKFPEYKKMMRDYEVLVNQIDEIEKTLSLGNKSGIDSGIRKLTSIFKENAEYRKKLVDSLEDSIGKELTGQIAGLALNPKIPRGAIGRVITSMGVITSGASGGLISPAFLAALSIGSPRIVGEFLNVIGKAIKAKQQLQGPFMPGVKARQAAFQTGRIAPVVREREPRQLQQGAPQPQKGTQFRPTSVGLQGLRGRSTLQ